MSYSANSNGVGYRIDPYFAGTNGDDFLSNSVGASSQTVYIAFDRDVLSFSIEVRGATATGGTIVGYDVAGNVIDTKSVVVNEFTTTSFFNRLLQRRTTDYAQYEIRGSATGPLRSIRIIPRSGDTLGMRNLSLFSAVTPYQPPPVILTPGQNANLSQTIDLASLVTLSLPSVERTYIKNTMLSIPQQELTIRNLSQDIDIRCGLRGTGGVSFFPPTVDLLRNSTATVNVLFDTAQINDLGEGTNTFTTILDLTTSTPIVQPLVPLPPAPIVTPPSQPLNKWNEERFHGAPFGVDNTSETTIFAGSPFLQQWVDNINYGDGNFPAPTTVRWTGKWTFEASRYTFNASVDDGMRVYVDGNLVIDEWKLGSFRSASRVLEMTAGVHDIKVEYFNGLTTGIAAFSFAKVTDIPPVIWQPVENLPVFTPPTATVPSGGGNSGGDSGLQPSQRETQITEDWFDSNDGYRRFQ